MFKCGFCQRITAPGESQTLVVTAERVREYKDENDQVISIGREIVKEVPSCLECARNDHN